MKLQFRQDYGTLSNARRTPQGGYLVDATLTRTGVLEYRNPDGTMRREYRSEAEVFRRDSLATLPDAPVTLRHPKEGRVHPGNYREHARGNVQAMSVRRDGDNVIATLAIQDNELISSIESGKTREVSCGYFQMLDQTPGTTETGERYDCVQTGIIYNHVAVLEKGRAGTAALRLDGAGNQTWEEDRTMLTIRIDGVDYGLNNEAEVKIAQAAQARYEAKLAKLEARADAAEAKLTETAKQLTEATDPAKIDAAVKSRISLVSKAQTVLGQDVRVDGLSEREIMDKVVQKAYPTLNLDGKSDDYVRALFETSEARADQAGNADFRAAAGARNDAGEKPKDKVQESKSKMHDAYKNAGKGKLALSK